MVMIQLPPDELLLLLNVEDGIEEEEEEAERKGRGSLLSGAITLGDLKVRPSEESGILGRWEG